MAISRLSLRLCRFKREEFSQASAFDEEEWREMMVKMIQTSAADDQVCVLNIQEHQIQHQMILADLNCLLKNGELPELLAREEQTFFLEGVKDSLPK